MFTEPFIIIMIMIILMKEFCECCIESERNGLLQIKSSLNPNSPNMLSSWGTSNSDCCNWERVHCNSTTGHVTRLDLSRITDVDFGDDWYLNTSLFLPFRRLTQLDLFSNNIAGCIQNEGFERLSTLTDLEILALHSNKFNNTILQSLIGLPSLKSLFLRDNKLEGIIDISELKNFTSNLQLLDLGWNEIEGFEDMQVKFDKLENLGLTANRLNSDALFSLGGLSSLKDLRLGYNNFTGSFNFSGLDGFNNLRQLDLIGNQINDIIVPPKDWAKFNKLESLSLDGNQVSWNTKNVIQSIGRLSTLKFLFLQGCGLNGSIPTSQGLCSLKHLQILVLQYNNLNGTLPWCMANLTSLKLLDLSHNQFTGNISSSPLQSFTSLDYLDLSHNRFRIPISLAPLLNHSQLKSLYVNDNVAYGDDEDHNMNSKFQLETLSFEGFSEGGTLLPGFLYHQHNLQKVYLSSIEMIGEFPHWLLENNTRLHTLDLSNNSLSGNLRLPCNPRVNLSYLDISNNFFSGYIPSNIGVYFPSLISLVMSKNELMSRIPDSLCNITELYIFDISQNNVYGAIPKCIFYMPMLQILDFSNNNISGTLPSNFSPSSLAIVNLSRNRLQGSLKDAFRSCFGLFLLDLSHNRFSGSIPSWIGELSELSFLVFGYNNFQGEIPIELCKFEQLSFIDLSHNRFNGQMLNCLTFTSSWSRKLYVAQIAEPLEITMKGRTYPYEQEILKFISGIDVSCNNLTGQIPLEIGDFTNLILLNLSHNSFIGTIPETLSNLKEIESLDLSCNALKGTIPPELTHLTNLAAFNVSYNNLSGPTPNEVAQFATFDDRSYIGNPFLCGWQLLKRCSGEDSPRPNVYDEENNNAFMEFFFVSFVVSYIMVLLVLVAVLRINLYCRKVWFYYVQMYIDKYHS